VIIDVWMPELNGLEVQLILHMIAPATPVIIMTAQDDPGTDRTAFTQGAPSLFLPSRLAMIFFWKPLITRFQQWSE
jgi:DNA-binding NtrC family response regulator